MRKALILFLALVLVIGGGYTAAFAAVNRTQDQVTWEETVLYGDPAAAQGLQITARNSQSNYLLWTTQGTLGPDGAPAGELATEFSFGHITWPSNSTPEGLLMYCAYDLYNLHSQQNVPAYTQQNFPELVQLVRDNWNSVSEGDPEVYFTVDMTQYLDYYLFSGWIDVDGGAWNRWDAFDYGNLSYLPESFLQAIQEYFRIPIYGKYTVEYSVNKEVTGSTSMGGQADMDYEPNFYGCASADACYFSFNAHTHDGNLADTSLIPGGYGIYRIQYTLDEKQELVLEDPLIETVFPLDPEVNYLEMSLSPDETKLYLLTEEDDFYMRTIIDLATMTQLQKFPLWQVQEGRGPATFQYADFWVVLDSAEEGDTWMTVFSMDEVGIFTEVFTVPMDTDAFAPSETMSLTGYWEHTMSFDGERLAIVQSAYNPLHQRYWLYDSSCDFYTVVYNGSGLAYAGLYQVNLSAINMEESRSDGPCKPMDYTPLDIKWK